MPKTTNKKVATKKVATKRVIRKKTTKVDVVEKFDFTKKSVVSAIRERLLNSSVGSKKLGAGYASLQQLRPSFVPFGDFALEAMTCKRGWISGNCYEIIGSDSAGKSTMVYHMIGNLLKQQIPSYLLLSQNKILTDVWVKRTLSDSVTTSEKLYDAVFADKVYTMVDAIEATDAFCRRIRREFPQLATQPVAVFLDSFGFLQPPDMAAGYVDQGVAVKSGSKKADSVKNLSDLANFGMSKLAHLWKQRLGYLLNRYNAFLVIVEDQNTRIDMQSSSLPAFMQPKEEHNRTKKGGRAFNQLSAVQWTLVDRGMRKDAAKQKIGHQIRMTTVKNTYGDKFRYVDYLLRTDGFADEGDYQQRTIDLSIPTLEMLMGAFPGDGDAGGFGITNKDGLFSSTYFGLYDVPAHEVVRAFESSPELVKWAGTALGIYGYDRQPVYSTTQQILGTEEEEYTEEEEGSFVEDVEKAIGAGEFDRE